MNELYGALQRYFIEWEVSGRRQAFEAHLAQQQSDREDRRARSAAEIRANLAELEAEPERNASAIRTMRNVLEYFES